MLYNDIIKFKGNKNSFEAMKIINYLLAAKYFDHFILQGENYVKITAQGITAHNSEQFLHTYNEEKGRSNFNKWMIGTNIVLATGVILSFYQDEFKQKKDGTTNIIIEMPKISQGSKISHPVLDTLYPNIYKDKINHYKIVADSSNE